ncbi:MAG: GNAT family N-acetyltransferase [Thermodesulfobacteriota bacterium]|nr:GNAT family N-acetyltransferase [Thermodesulfobacteriota bacterium]
MKYISCSTISAQEAIQKIKSGSHIYIGSGSAVPLRLMEALSQSMGLYIDDAEVIHLFVTQRLPYVESCLLGRFRLKTFHVGSGIDQAVAESCADYIPAFHSEIPGLITSGSLRIDVALIQVSPPDKYGFLNLGVGVDITRAAVSQANMVIAEVNPAMPRTHGTTHLHVDQVDYLVEGYDTLFEIETPAPDDVADRIGINVANLIGDGATIHTGFDPIPQAVLRHLKDKTDLGLHTEMFSDGLIPLVAAGVVNNAKKKIDRYKCIASFCMGTRRLFEYVDDNPIFEFKPTDYTNNPYIVSKNDGVVAVIGATRIDLTGQVAYSGAVDGAFGGFGGDYDFVKGASLSRGGKPVITLRSTSQGNRASNIVSKIEGLSGIVASRADVHYVVTEFGAVRLHGKCIRERAMSLISIAHPDFRETLIEEARAAGFIYRDQIFIKESGYLYPYDLEEIKNLKDGLRVLFRPIRPDDEPLMKEFFYDFSPEAIRRRYFTRMKSMPHERLQKYVNVDYQRTLSIVGTLGGPENEKIIAEGRYTIDPATHLADVAFTVNEKHQNKGISSALLEFLGDIAKSRGVKGFTADVLKENAPMLKVLEKFCPNLKMTMPEPGVYHVKIPFDS